MAKVKSIYVFIKDFGNKKVGEKISPSFHIKQMLLDGKFIEKIGSETPEQKPVKTPKVKAEKVKTKKKK